MGEEPEAGEGQGDDGRDKKGAAVAALRAKGGRTALALTGSLAVALIVQRDRDIEALAPFIRADEQFLALPAACLFRHLRRFLDHALEVFHLLAQIVLALLQLQLLLGQRGIGRRTAAGHSPNELPGSW